MAKVTHREEVLNVVFAENLARFGVAASPETVNKLKGVSLPDVVFIFRGLRCVVEGKHADVAQARKKVATQAIERIESGLAQITIAVIYPKELRTTAFDKLPDRLANSDFEFAIATEVGLTDWRTGGTAQILDELRRAQQSLAGDDAVQKMAEQLSARLDGIANIFLAQPVVCDRLTKILGVGSPTNETADDADKRRETSAKVAALTIANAFIFQEQLSAADERVKTVQALLKASNLLTATREHWTWICEEINYVPIFRVAEELLSNLPASGSSLDVVRELANQALSICSNRAALRHDLMGRIYHWLLHQAKYLGTYYTSVPAATLLLKLTLDPSNWSGTKFDDFKSFGELRIADPACGTGTLLMAASQAMTDNFVRARASAGMKLDDKAMRNLHQTLMENVLHGYDVLSSAIHLTASTLALLAPEVAFRKMRLYAMPLGRGTGKSVQLGSLDFLSEKHIPVQFSLEGVAESAAETLTAKGKVLSQAPLPKLHICVMNPPFTRSVNGNLLFGSIPDARGDMQKELKRRVLEAGLAASITAGLGSVFVALADMYLEPNGRLALVLPAALTTGDAWSKTRELIAARYHLETIVTSHDAARWAFSENTELSEVLVVARKRQPTEKPEKLMSRFVNLWHNPRSSGEALAIAHGVSRIGVGAPLHVSEAVEHGVAPIRVGGKKFGEVVHLPTVETADTWIGGAFAQTEALRAAVHLMRGKLYLPGSSKTWPLPITPLGSLGQFGPDGRDIHDGFELSDTETNYPALWGTDGERITTILQQPNKWLTPRTKAAPNRHKRDIGLLWPRAARLMLSTRLWLPTQRLFAVTLPQPALSNIWAPTIIEKSSHVAEPTLAAWLNSTLGLLTVLLVRVPTRGSWIQFKKPNLRNLLVLDMSEVSDKKKEGLLKAFEHVKNSEFLPYSKMANDPIRAELDDAVSRALDLPDLSPIRALIGREPIVTGVSLTPESADAEDEVLSDQFMMFGTDS